MKFEFYNGWDEREEQKVFFTSTVYFDSYRREWVVSFIFFLVGFQLTVPLK